MVGVFGKFLVKTVLSLSKILIEVSRIILQDVLVIFLVRSEKINKFVSAVKSVKIC